MVFGVQLFTLRKFLKEESAFPAVFEKVKNMGAETIQISATGPFDSKVVGKLVKDLGLTVCATHSKFDRIENDLDKLAEEHLDLGCPQIGIGMLPSKFIKKSADDAKKFAEFLNVTGDKLKKYNLTIAYHNHWFEFKKIEGSRTLLDILREETEDFVRFILDAFWIKVGGEDPASYIDKFKNRIDVLHLKDYKKGLIFPKILPLGDGKLDFAGILGHAEQAGAKDTVVELDFAKEPFGDLEKSLRYIEKVYSGLKKDDSGAAVSGE